MSTLMTPPLAPKYVWSQNGSPAALQQVSNMLPTGPVPGISSNVKLKRRFEGDDESRESSSPPPTDRPKKAAPKRTKVSPSHNSGKDSSPSSTSSPSKSSDNDDVDIGVLLASLPPESLLPLLNSLIKEHPGIKSSVLSLIPRPTLNVAIEALTTASRQLRDAYPYSNPSTSHIPTPNSVFFPSSSLSSFGSAIPARTPVFPSSSASLSSWPSRSASFTDSGGMRETYIQSRLRPHIEKFVATCLSYLAYFTLLPPQQEANSPLMRSVSHSGGNRDPSSIHEAYAFLSHLTSQILSQQPLTQSSLIPLILPRLSQEWMAWAKRVDEHVNVHAGMFGTDVVNNWARSLDDFCRAKPPSSPSASLSPSSSPAFSPLPSSLSASSSSPSASSSPAASVAAVRELVEVMQNTRKQWVVSVGWLIGRFPSPEPMDV